MFKRLIAGFLILTMVIAVPFSMAEEEFYRPNRKNKPMFVVNCDYAPDTVSWNDSNPGNYYPAGSFIYNWFDSSDWAEVPQDYVGLDWVGDSSFIQRRYLSFEPDSSIKKPPIFVDYCDEWVSLRKEPSASSSRVAKLNLGTRIDDWSIHNSDFLYVEIGGNKGYVSLDYLSFPTFDAYMSFMVSNCDSWVSLRAEANSSSERLMKVPKGTMVEKCNYYSEDFYICEVNGVIGFIDMDYAGY